jgi:hypothetical protein
MSRVWPHWIFLILLRCKYMWTTLSYTACTTCLRAPHCVHHIAYCYWNTATVCTTYQEYEPHCIALCAPHVCVHHTLYYYMSRVWTTQNCTAWITCLSYYCVTTCREYEPHCTVCTTCLCAPHSVVVHVNCVNYTELHCVHYMYVCTTLCIAITTIVYSYCYCYYSTVTLCTTCPVWIQAYNAAMSSRLILLICVACLVSCYV